MQPTGTREIRSSKSSPSKPEWNEWVLDSNSQLRSRALGVVNERWGHNLHYPERNIRQEERTESRRPGQNERCSSTYSAPGNVSSNSDLQTQGVNQAKLGSYYPRPPLKRPNYFSSNGSGPSSSFPSTQTRQANYSYGDRSYGPSTQPEQLDPSYESSSYDPSIRPQNSSPLVGYRSSVNNHAPRQPSYNMPSAQSQLSSNPVERKSPSFGDSALGKDFSGSQGESEYVSITKPGGYFKPGRIFRTTLAESEKGSEDIQTFVVLQEGQDVAVCAPLQAYDTDGSEYSFEGESRPLVFATGSTPQLLPGEDPPRVGKFPVFVEEPSDRIDPKLRLDFNNALTIEHNAKVRNVGRIDRNYVKELKSTFLKTKGAKLPDSNTRQAGFGYNNNAEEDNSKSSREYFNDNPVTNDMETSAEEPLTQSGYSDKGQPEYSYSRPRIDSAQYPPASPRERSIHQTDRSPGHNYKTSTVVNKGTPAAESFAPSGSEDNVTRKITASSQFSPGKSLNPDFRVHRSKTFRVGSVFKMLWTEPLGEGNSDGYETETAESMSIKYGQSAYRSIRRFVVVNDKQGHSLCLPIMTYGGQGTAKPGVIPQDHAIIYTSSSGNAPKELPGEEKLMYRPIRVDPLTARDRLSPESRINYAKLYTVEHNLKVCFIGRIHTDSLDKFFMDFNSTFAKG